MVPMCAMRPDKKNVKHPAGWWYEEEGGITVVSDCGRQFWIPVARLRSYVARHDREGK